MSSSNSYVRQVLELIRPELACAALAFISSGCGSDSRCTEEGIYGLRVAVFMRGAASPVCDASVRVRSPDGQYQEQLMPFDCTYLGLGERAGTFFVTVERPGYTPSEAEVTVRQGPCHVETKDLDVWLSPAPSDPARHGTDTGPGSSAPD